jgi:hypothetical protein
MNPPLTKPPPKGEQVSRKTFGYPKRLAFLEFALAFTMALALYIGTKPALWGWLLFLPLFLVLMIEGARTYRYSLTLEGEHLVVANFRRTRHPIAAIAAVDVWVAKGGHVAVITFSNSNKLSFTSRVSGFDELVQLLRKQANLTPPQD